MGVKMIFATLLLIFLISNRSGAAVPLRHEDGSLAQHTQLVRTLAAAAQDEHGARIPLPGPIPVDTEQIKKVAQILLVLGEQVIPAILGEAGGVGAMKIPELSNDDVTD